MKRIAEIRHKREAQFIKNRYTLVASLALAVLLSRSPLTTYTAHPSPT
jgi:hypothetical protein